MTLIQIGKIPFTGLIAAWTLGVRLLPARAAAAILRKYTCPGHR